MGTDELISIEESEQEDKSEESEDYALSDSGLS